MDIRRGSNSFNSDIGYINIIFVFSLGPKRASKIRKLFNLTKEDDVCQYATKRPLPLKEVWTFPPFLSLAILLTIKSLFQWPSVLHHVNFIGSKFNCEFWFFQLWFKSFSMLKNNEGNDQNWTAKKCISVLSNIPSQIWYAFYEGSLQIITVPLQVFQKTKAQIFYNVIDLIFQFSDSCFARV